MIKLFMILVSFLVIFVSLMGVHYSDARSARADTSLQTLSRLTAVTSFSLSTAYYEPKALLEVATHPAYPQMQRLDTMDYVYAK